MNSNREQKIRMDEMTRPSFAGLFIFYFVIFVVICIVAAFGPTMLNEKPPSGGTGVPLASRNQRCVGLEGQFERCWNHIFKFHYRWTQYFVLEARVNRRQQDLNWEGSKTLKFDVTWEGSTDSGETWEVISKDEELSRRVHCNEGDVECDYFIVFKSTIVKYNAYYFEIKLLGTDEELEFIKDFDFLFVYKNRDFSIYELGFKYVFSFISILVFIYFRRAVNGIPEQSLSFIQSWITWLLIGLIFFNNPLFAFEYTAPRSFFSSLGVIFQMTYITMLLLFWLVMFDGMLKEEPFPTSFYVKKCAFIGVYYILGLVFYLYITVMEWHDPLYDWHENKEHVRALTAISAIFVIVYLVWMFNILCNITTRLRTAGPNQGNVFTFHIIVMLCCGGGLIFGALVGLQVDTALDFMFFHGLFNFYMYILVYLYSPIKDESTFELMGRNLDRRDSVDEEEFNQA